MPIRANGAINFKVTDYVALIEKIAHTIKQSQEMIDCLN